MCGTSLTLFFIETGDRGGAGRTHPHQQTVKNDGWTRGHPTLNNAYQVGGVCGGGRVNEGGAVGGLGGVTVAEKQSWSQERRG